MAQGAQLTQGWHRGTAHRGGTGAKAHTGVAQGAQFTGVARKGAQGTAE